MKKIFFTIIIFIFRISLLNAQCLGPNLVPNPSFENYSSCPDNTSGPNPGQDQYEKIDSWSNTFNNIGPKMTPDVYNSCSPGQNGVPWTNGVSITNPLAADGEGYAGLVTFISGSFNRTTQFREYISAQLNTNLQAGKRYMVRFKWRIPTGDWVLYTNRFGMYFSNGIPNTYYPVLEAPSVLDVTPQIELPTTDFLDETSQWVDFRQDFVANGGEDYITLGNFYKDDATTVSDVNAFALGYVFVDEISVREILVSENISVSPDVTINPGDTTILNVTPTGGAPTYSWTAIPNDPTLSGQENSQNPNVSPLENTTYIVSADFGNGCIIEERILVTVNTPCPAVVATANPTTIVLNEGSVQLNVSPTANHYYHTWSGSASSDLNATNLSDPIFTPTSVGTFIFTVETNFNGTCVNTADVTVIVTELPIPNCGDNLIPNPSFENIEACPAFPGRLEPDAYYWESPTNAPADLFAQCATSSSVSTPTNNRGNLAPSDGENYAGFFAYFALTDNYRQYISVKLLEPLKAGQQYDISYNLALATNYSIAIDQLGMYLSPDELPPNYTNGLLAANPQVVTPSGQPLNSKSWQQIALGYTAVGGEEYIYIGNFNSDSNTNVTNASGGSINNTAYYYIDEVSIIEKNCTGCTLLVDTDSSSLNNPDCGQTNGSITGITVTGNSGSETYSWTNASGTEVGTVIDLSAIGQGDYTLTITDGSCSDTAGPFTINENGGPVLDISNISFNNADCGLTNGSITGIAVTGNSGNETYSWTNTNGNQIANTIDLIGVGPENYLLTVAQGACTTTSGPYTLTENNAPILDDSDIQINNADCDQTNGSITGIIITNPSGNETYSWTDTSGTQVGTDINLIGRGPGSYSLNVEVGACVATIGPFSINELNDCEDPTTPNIRIATALTPNGDGSNDMFMIRGLENYPNNRLYIFNRWGNKVYETSNYQNDWYGNYQNKPLPVATYYYILELNDSNRKIYKGAITIIK